jgi:hypothetical protein
MAQTLWQWLRFVGKGHIQPFSLLILIGRFVTLEAMKIKSVTPMHHPMSMDSPAVPAGGGLALGGCHDPE